MEIWDAYDAEGNFLGFNLIRDEWIPEGMFHLVCECLIHHVDGDTLLMQRYTTKPSYGGMYETTAGGSALKGENSLQCVRREVLEETGLHCNQFIEIGRSINVDRRTIYHSLLASLIAKKILL